MIPMNNNGKVYIVMGYFKDCDVPLKVFSNEDTAAAFANIMLGPAVDEGQIDIIERIVDDTTFEGYDDDGDEKEDECDEDECEDEEECDEEDDEDDDKDEEETEDMKHAREELENWLSFLEFINILQKIKEEK